MVRAGAIFRVEYYAGSVNVSILFASGNTTFRPFLGKRRRPRLKNNLGHLFITITGDHFKYSSRKANTFAPQLTSFFVGTFRPYYFLSFQFHHFSCSLSCSPAGVSAK
jgi:hypothetical protein